MNLVIDTSQGWRWSFFWDFRVGGSILVCLAIVSYVREFGFSVARGSITSKKELQLHDLDKF